MDDHHGMSAEMRECIERCANCHRLCVQTIQYCLAIGGPHAEQAHVRLMADCAQICAVAADFMSRRSPFHVRTCGLCAEVCQRCGEDCADRAAGGAAMTECADACRVCADACRAMSAKR